MNVTTPDSRRGAAPTVVVLSALLSLGATAWTSAAAAASDRPVSERCSPPMPDPSLTSDPSPSQTQDPSASPAPVPNPGPSPTPSPTPPPTPAPCPSPRPEDLPSPPAIRGSRLPTPPNPSHGSDATPTPTDESQGVDLGDLYRGTFSTQKLVEAAQALRREGWSEEMIRRRVYAPFIVVGPASWSDSWGAPRFGPGLIVRTHEGQDVLCEYGADVLAPEDGVIEFDTGFLGGREARLHRPGGGYWYFAHLSAWNLDALSTGDPVHTGDVIGYCGSTGNATIPHVHFGHYGADGAAIDPMASLVSWLREAERDLDVLPTGTSTHVLQVIRQVATTAPAVEDPPPPFWFADGPTDPAASIDGISVVGQALVLTGRSDSALELTLVWVAVIACASIGRTLQRLFARGSKRIRATLIGPSSS